MDTSLMKELPSSLEKFDINLTEVENMKNNGFGVYYGPGTIKWEWKRSDCVCNISTDSKI
jgi:hypothetical protein